ncbi:biliverdin-producing heme oxygenase [Paracoccus aerodenitrificans]|uniref:biliverdin-producing heme oxygenase n=1 Tax=Paracoccus aerodenitrificans TaxID=3017781 RepID=UPI0022F11B4B|nr:biliverdin-producing heme oxygenase [Paracoccus aerodenitrificans]WBU65367.1 biliverdin-producing heme oxygenase [Paracoccus aerodenitrificans]
MTTTTQISAPAAELPLTKYLRQTTEITHDGVDDLIQKSGAFDCAAKYRNFLKVQYQLFADVEPLYHREDLQNLIPDLQSRSRLNAVRTDADALGVDLTEGLLACCDLSEIDRAEAAGWLYVTEGSKLGAAFLAKAAQKLGITEENGAAHLAPSPEGRAADWREFIFALNDPYWSEADTAAAAHAAQAAFSRVRELISAHLY